MIKVKQQLSRIIFLPFFLATLLSGCTSDRSPTTNNTAQTETPATEQTATASSETGTLQIRANGEDFIRQGFVSKDGWQIEFDRAYVTLADVTAYQSEPPFDPQSDKPLEAKTQVSLSEPKTIDLAAGDEKAEPILIGEANAPAGRYNALSWKMVPATTGEASGYPLVLQGKATKEGKTVDFILKMQPEMTFTCGDFVGDARKGILEKNQTADLEATFHFDHLFGDGETSADDELNQGALGFEPLAALAQDGKLEADTSDLKEKLSDADYAKLMKILPSLGHVGEGHCKETQLKT